MHTRLLSRQGPPFEHEQGAITTVSADGTAAAAGAPTIGVLATKGHDSVIYPQTALTFQTEGAVTVETRHFERRVPLCRTGRLFPSPQRTRRLPPGPTYVYGGPGYYPYPYWGYPYWGPSVGFGIGFGGWGGWRGGWRRW